MRIAVATPLPRDLFEYISARHPDVEVIWEPDLLPPMRWPGDFGGDPSFVRTPEQRRRFEAILDSADVLYGIPDVSPEQLRRTVESNSRLLWVMVMAAGGGATVKAAQLLPEDLRRVAFTTSAGVHAGPLAEFALFGLLCGAKNLPRLQSDQRAHLWPPRWSMEQLSQWTVAVVGMGHLGQAIACKLQDLGVKVLGINKSLRTVPGVQMLPVEDLAEAVAQADAVVSTLPGTEATRQIISEQVIKNFRPGATFVSIGRGSVVDEEALIGALADGSIGFAALDVFEREPLPPQSPLWDLPNVLISPHTAANSPTEERLIAELFCDNLDRWKRGEPLVNLVDTRHFY